MKKFLIGFASLLTTFASTNVNAESYPQSYRQGVIYVNYSLTGDAAVKKEDLNLNGVPDVVEDIATQINAVRDLFHNVYGFPDPLNSQRYKNIYSIDVDIDLKKNMDNNHGLAYRGVRKQSTHSPNERALRIKLANIVEPRTASTPTHEYFHLIQNGATYFRNGWFFEGMARWSQDAVEIKNYPTAKNFPQMLNNKSYKQEIFELNYKAAQMLWFPLAISLKDKSEIPDYIIKKYRYVDGSPVFEDNIFYGPNVMRKMLSTMKANEDRAAEPFGGRKQWLNKGGHSDSNNEIIFDCVRNVYNDKI